jgi:hypothetical protein
VEIDRALTGYVPSQKHLAECLAHGRCYDIVAAHVPACVWRHILVDEVPGDQGIRLEADETCSGLGASLMSAVAEAERDLEGRMAQEKARVHEHHRS